MQEAEAAAGRKDNDKASLHIELTQDGQDGWMDRCELRCWSLQPDSVVFVDPNGSRGT